MHLCAISMAIGKYSRSESDPAERIAHWSKPCSNRLNSVDTTIPEVAHFAQESVNWALSSY